MILKYGDPPCWFCTKPVLWEANASSWDVFVTASSQMIVVGMGTPLGLEFAAIDRSIEHHEIHPLERREVFEKVRRVGEAYANHLNKRSEARTAGKKKETKSSFEPPPMRQSRIVAEPEPGA